jgi:hypothetical protein
MRQIPIAQVEVAASGLLHVKPSVPDSEDFEHIYRTATGVRWLRDLRVLAPAKVVELSLAQWFAEIVTAVASEYGVRLTLTPETEWENIPERLRSEIEAVEFALPSNTSLERTRDK